MENSVGARSSKALYTTLNNLDFICREQDWIFVLESHTSISTGNEVRNTNIGGRASNEEAIIKTHARMKA